MDKFLRSFTSERPTLGKSRKASSISKDEFNTKRLSRWKVCPGGSCFSVYPSSTYPLCVFFYWKQRMYTITKATNMCISGLAPCKLHVLAGALHWKMSQTYTMGAMAANSSPFFPVDIRWRLLLGWFFVGWFFGGWKTRWRSHGYHYPPSQYLLDWRDSGHVGPKIHDFFMTCCTCKGYHSNSNSPSWVHEWEHEVTGVMETNYKYSEKQEKSGLCESQSWSLLIGGTGQILLKEAKPLATPPPSDMLFFLGEIATAPSTKWKKNPHIHPPPNFRNIKKRVNLANQLEIHQSLCHGGFNFVNFLISHRRYQINPSPATGPLGHGHLLSWDQSRVHGHQLLCTTLDQCL